MSSSTKQNSYMQRLAPTVITVVVLSVVGAGLVTIGASTEPFGAVNPEDNSSLVVSVVSITRQDSYGVRREYVGIVEARRESRVGFELSGKITELLVDDGAVIHSGEVLGRLDTALLDAERVTLVADHDQARATLALAHKFLTCVPSLWIRSLFRSSSPDLLISSWRRLTIFNILLCIL